MIEIVFDLPYALEFAVKTAKVIRDVSAEYETYARVREKCCRVTPLGECEHSALEELIAAYELKLAVPHDTLGNE